MQRETSEKFRDIFKEVDIHPNAKGQTLLVADKITRMKKFMRDSQAELERKKKNILAPEMNLDYDNRRVTFNNEIWILNPPAEEIQADIKVLVEYINSTDIFTGDTKNLKILYWKIILYMFASPFFARLRYFYDQIVPANSTGKAFPMYMILRGGTNGGKSSIVATGQKLMFDKILPTVPAKDVTPVKMAGFKLTVKGCPILADDVTNNYLKFIKDIVKDDYFLISDKILNHGTFIFTSNDAEQIKQEISKRVVVFTIENQLDEDIAIRRDPAMKKMRDNMHNALYRAYLAKIFPAVEKLTDEIIRGGSEDWRPDIFKISSETLIEIFREHGLDIPKELKVFQWEDYLGEEIKSKRQSAR